MQQMQQQPRNHITPRSSKPPTTNASLSTSAGESYALPVPSEEHARYTPTSPGYSPSSPGQITYEQFDPHSYHRTLHYQGGPVESGGHEFPEGGQGDIFDDYFIGNVNMGASGGIGDTRTMDNAAAEGRRLVKPLPKRKRVEMDQGRDSPTYTGGEQRYDIPVDTAQQHFIHHQPPNSLKYHEYPDADEDLRLGPEDQEPDSYVVDLPRQQLHLQHRRPPDDNGGGVEGLLSPGQTTAEDDGSEEVDEEQGSISSYDEGNEASRDDGGILVGVGKARRAGIGNGAEGDTTSDSSIVTSGTSTHSSTVGASGIDSLDPSVTLRYAGGIDAISSIVTPPGLPQYPSLYYFPVLPPKGFGSNSLGSGHGADIFNSGIRGTRSMERSLRAKYGGDARDHADMMRRKRGEDSGEENGVYEGDGANGRGLGENASQTYAPNGSGTEDDAGLSGLEALVRQVARGTALFGGAKFGKESERHQQKLREEESKLRGGLSNGRLDSKSGHRQHGGSGDRDDFDGDYDDFATNDFHSSTSFILGGAGAGTTGPDNTMLKHSHSNDGGSGGFEGGVSSGTGGGNNKKRKVPSNAAASMKPMHSSSSLTTTATSATNSPSVLANHTNLPPLTTDERSWDDALVVAKGGRKGKDGSAALPAQTSSPSVPTNPSSTQVHSSATHQTPQKPTPPDYVLVPTPATDPPLSFTVKSEADLQAGFTDPIKFARAWKEGKVRIKDLGDGLGQRGGDNPTHVTTVNAASYIAAVTKRHNGNYQATTKGEVAASANNPSKNIALQATPKQPSRTSSTTMTNTSTAPPLPNPPHSQSKQRPKVDLPQSFRDLSPRARDILRARRQRAHASALAKALEAIVNSGKPVDVAARESGLLGSPPVSMNIVTSEDDRSVKGRTEAVKQKIAEVGPGSFGLWVTRKLGGTSFDFACPSPALATRFTVYHDQVQRDRERRALLQLEALEVLERERERERGKALEQASALEGPGRATGRQNTTSKNMPPNGPKKKTFANAATQTEGRPAGKLLGPRSADPPPAPLNPAVADNGEESGSNAPQLQNGKGKQGNNKGKGKKKRSAKANANNVHHRDNYVPSRLPNSTSTNRPSHEPPPPSSSSTQAPHPQLGSSSMASYFAGQDEWICAFCEYELFFGEPPLLARCMRRRKSVLRVRRRARERAAKAANGGSGKGDEEGGQGGGEVVRAGSGAKTQGGGSGTAVQPAVGTPSAAPTPVKRVNGSTQTGGDGQDKVILPRGKV